MASKPLIVASLLGASVGVPYVASHSELIKNATSKPPAAASASYGARPGAPLGTAPYGMAPGATIVGPTGQAPGVYPYGVAPRLDGAQFTSVDQVFRFDVTRDWVYRNWSRKTTAPTDVGLDSVRVPLVMGTQLQSFAGSLTYFFNAQGQVEHISFRGKSGDPTPLVQLLTRSYQFQRVEAPVGEHVYQVGSGNELHSELRLRPEAIVSSSAPQQSVAVELEFAKPGSPRFLPPRTPPLQIPQVESPPPVAEATPAAAPANSTTEAVKAAAGNYWDQIRYANPSEESELRNLRWPN